MKTEKMYGSIREEVRGKKPYYMILEYYLTEEGIGEKYCDLKRYGVIITKTAVDTDGGKTTERKEIDDIFFNLSEAEEFIYKLIRNRVTPIAFKNVVEDYIESTFYRTRQGITA